MKPFSTLLAVAAATAVLHATSVAAHGKMTSPAVRLTNAKYNKDAHFSLRNAGNGETQIAPLELLNQRGQADNPAAPTFDIMNGCRGIEYEAGAPVTNVSPGQSLPIRWEIAAPHPGYMEVYIVRATKESSGKVMYKQDGAPLKRIEDFAKAGGAGSDSVTIPANLSGCGTAGNCALQFYWYSDIAKQTYVNCADIVAAGTGNAAAPAAGGGGNSPASAGDDTPAAAPTPASRAPAAGGSGNGNNRPSGGGNTPAAGGGNNNRPSGGGNAPAAGGGNNNRPSGGGNAPAATPTPSRATPALTPAAPAPTPYDDGAAADAASPPKKKACNKRMRRQ